MEHRLLFLAKLSFLSLLPQRPGLLERHGSFRKAACLFRSRNRANQTPQSLRFPGQGPGFLYGKGEALNQGKALEAMSFDRERWNQLAEQSPTTVSPMQPEERRKLVWLDLCSGLGGASQPALDR